MMDFFLNQQVYETAAVHCGFYSENGGFKISDEDRDYMLSCKVVVSTCSFGGGDDLYQPIGMTEASLRKVSSLASSAVTCLAIQVNYSCACQILDCRRFAMLHFGMKSLLLPRNQLGVGLVRMDLLGNGALLSLEIFLSWIRG